MERIAPILLQMGAPSGLIGLLVHLLIICIVVGAILYIASLVPGIPKIVITIAWVILIAVIAIYAILFLARFL